MSRDLSPEGVEAARSVAARPPTMLSVQPEAHDA